ncbi:hypothetical protein [Trebonia sp.]|jgi:hypothetical protein|uniref:hypothetical protein n=1 Tax=Trebonia sp. TaxID=2767075 RepID=UPI003BB112EA
MAVEPVDELPADDARLVSWAGPAFILFSIVLIPWTIYLGLNLPDRQESSHYNIAWVGFDVMLLVVLAATGFFALRRSPFLAVGATAAATLLVVDAWFDVVTSPPGSQFLQSLASAVLIELPLAAVCGWLAYHTEHLEEERIVLLLPRPRGLPVPPDPPRPRGNR